MARRTVTQRDSTTWRPVTLSRTIPFPGYSLLPITIPSHPLTLQVRTNEERMAQLRAELLLREESYNKHFKNGGAGERMLNVGAALNAQVMFSSWLCFLPLRPNGPARWFRLIAC